MIIGCCFRPASRYPPVLGLRPYLRDMSLRAIVIARVGGGRKRERQGVNCTSRPPGNRSRVRDAIHASVKPMARP